MNYKTVAEKAIKKYPDLKDLGNDKMIVYAYRFREEQLRNLLSWKTTEVANGRCLEPGVRIGEWLHYRDILSDDPEWLKRISFNVFDECIVCREAKKTIPICSGCWEKIRKCLELKGKSHREGWDGWGYEMGLDLEPLKQLLREHDQL